jgi:hypothetical protein
MIGKNIKCVTEGGQEYRGTVELVYTGIWPSGNNQYVPVTYLLVRGDKGDIYSILPRNVMEILPNTGPWANAESVRCG